MRSSMKWAPRGWDIMPGVLQPYCRQHSGTAGPAGRLASCVCSREDIRHCSCVWCLGALSMLARAADPPETSVGRPHKTLMWPTAAYDTSHP